jgi:hypothetical protein
MAPGRRTLRSRSVVAVTVALTLAAAAMLASPASANQVGDAGRFDTWTGYDVGRSPVAVATADFNGDGAPDVAWARHDFFHGQVIGNTMVVQMNLGEGTLGEAVSYPAVDDSNDIAVGDLNGDGAPDLVVVSEGSALNNTTIDLYLNDGSGAFTHRTTTGGSAPARVVLTDLNGDGSPDLAMTNGWGANDISVVLNNGDGTFAAGTDVHLGETGSLAGGLAAADLNGDGSKDLAVGWQNLATNAGTVSLFMNDGNGGFAGTPTDLIVADPNEGQSMSAPQVAAGELNGDANVDLVAAGGGQSDHVVLFNDGGLSFTQLHVTAGFNSTNLHTVDFEGDGDVDVFSATMGSSLTGDVTLLRNNGDSTFTTETIESSHQPVDVDTADFNLDGKLDLAVPNQGSGTVAVHPQGAGAAFEAPPTYPTFSEPNGVATADFNLDGSIDVAASVPVSNVIDVKFNDGTGVLTPGTSVPSATGTPTSVWATTIDANASPDLLWIPGSGTHQFAYALNNGDGTFGAVYTKAVSTCGIGRLTTFDVNGDGTQDALVGSGNSFCSNSADNQVSVTLNNGDGTFGAETMVDLGVSLPTMVVAGDLNGDGIVDLAAAGATTPCCGAGQGDVGVALGTGGVTFDAASQFTTDHGHREIAIGDLDGNGSLDLATTNNADAINATTSVLLNDGAGAFSDISTFDGETISNLLNEVAIAIGDLNGDGNADVAVANRTGKDVGVYYGLGGGAFDPTQVRYGMHAELQDVALADLNGDGRLDLAGPTAGTTTGAAGLRHKAAAAATSTDGVSVLLNGGGSVPVTHTLAVTRAGGGSGTVTSTPTGIACGTDCSETYAAATAVSLVATPNRLSTFAGWSGACTGVGTCQVVMNDDTSVTATFSSGDGGGVLFPTAVKVGTGSLVSGTAASLNADDNVYLVVRSTKSGTRTASWVGRFTNVSNSATSLLVTYKGKTSSPCTQVISIFRWSDSTWVQLDSRTLGAGEVKVANLSPSGTLAAFVSGTSGLGEVRVQVSCSSPTAPFRLSGDLLRLVT